MVMVRGLAARRLAFGSGEEFFAFDLEALFGDGRDEIIFV